MMRAAILLLGSLLATSLHAAPAITATMSTNTIRVGDRVALTIHARHNPDERVIVPSIQREPYILVWDSSSSTRPDQDEQLISETKIIFTSFVIGEHRLSTNNLIVIGKNQSGENLAFPELVIRVESLLTNPPPALADIKSPVRPASHAWLRVVAMIVLTIAAGILAALLIRRWWRRTSSAPEVRRLPPHEIALTALQALRDRGLIERGETGPFYVELSAIVRMYVEDRFDLHAPEQTTEEFIRASSQSRALSLEHRQVTQEFLEQSDLVKFARHTPSAHDMERAWDAAAKLVRETMEATPAP